MPVELDVDPYARAGVNIDAGNEAVERIASHVARTTRPEVTTLLGGFGAGFALDVARWREPVLVSATDGVGTKLKVAAMADRFDTVGQDLVAMCVNDIVAMGAEPLFFLDYLATAQVDPARVEQIVAGIADGCELAGCALVGGETAEMPGMYAQGDVDLAGFVVGVRERSGGPDPSQVQAGDVLVGLGSSGLHSNGYSLVRELVFEQRGWTLGEQPAQLAGRSLGDELLEPTRIYARSVLDLLGRGGIRAIAHITGGGLLENVPRALPDGLGCTIDPGAWQRPPVFDLLAELLDHDEQVLHRVFNMGIGMVLVCDPLRAGQVLAHARELGERAWQIGTVHDATGDQRVELRGGSR